MSSISASDQLRAMAANILASTSADVREDGNNLADIKAVPVGGRAKAIFDAKEKISTAELVAMAKKLLNERIAQAPNNVQFEKIKKQFQTNLKKLEEKGKLHFVDPEKYLKANPDPGDNIPSFDKLTKGEKLGSGAYGTTYVGTVDVSGSKTRVAVIKEGEGLQDEGKIGQRLTQAKHDIGEETLLSSKQGLDLTVLGRLEEATTRGGKKIDVVIQPLVDGVSLAKTVRRATDQSANVLSKNPQEVIQRLAALSLQLHALHEHGIVHDDLHNENVMIAKKKLPEEVIRAKAEANGQNPSELAENDQYQYLPQIIDFGKSGEESGERTKSGDIRSFGLLIPQQLFGEELIGMFDNPSFAMILEKFKNSNKVMKEKTGNSYPPQVLERLAQMTADCLLMDPDKRPTAEHLSLALQNMGLSKWDSDNPIYNYMPQPERGSEEARIQGEFSWINPPPAA
jgi:hypothetical protein